MGARILAPCPSKTDLVLPAQQLERDLGAVGGIARRALTRVEGGVVQQLLPPEQKRLRRTAVGARRDVEQLVDTITKEIPDAG